MSDQATVLSKRSATTLYKVRGWSGASLNGETVVLKVLDAETPSLEQLGRFLHELSVSKVLADAGVAGVRRGVERTRHEGRHALVLQYFEGDELSAAAPPKTVPDVLSRLEVCADVATSLGGLHDAGVIHRDIKPSNVLVASSGATSIIDLGHASLIEVKGVDLGHPSRIEGTLLYMSPEQTGRMNRTLDYRTDLYSLGATVFEVLTGLPPFTSRDPLELVHCHLARVPPTATSVNPIVPEIVSRLVARLLEKNPTDRYQSARGLAGDLRALVARGRKGEALEALELGRHDAPTRFTIPEKLYGREAEEATLLAAFDRAQAGRAQVVCILGPSGVGKSALVGQVYKPMTEHRGSAVRGKFDQLSRSVPYSALTRAFTDLVALLLTQDDETLASFRRDLRAALGDLGGVLLGLMPNLPLVVGELPPAPALEGQAAQHRLQWVMRRFVHAVSRRDHPVVLFVDDLQWADAASLDLLQSLLSDPEAKHLLLIAAFRDNETPPEHPVHAMLDGVREADVEPQQLTLQNLGEADVAHLVADSTRCPLAEAEALAKVVHDKTRGNAFFVHQFLDMLAERGLLAYSIEHGRWLFSPDAVRAVSVTENVVDLLTDKLRAEDEDTQRVLQLAASLGNRFELSVLAAISGRTKPDLGRALAPALASGLVSPVGRGYLEVEAADELSQDVHAEYAFAHDRVQQAAYAIAPLELRKKTHLEAGRVLRKAVGADDDNRVFEAARHLAAEELLSDPSERVATAGLNLRAARRAFASGAYRQALDHAERGLGLLPKDAWTSQYDLEAQLSILASQIAGIEMDEARVRRAADDVLAHAKTGFERSQVYGDLALVAMAQEDLTGSVELGRKALAELDVHFPRSPGMHHIILALLWTKISLRGRVEVLAEGPALADRRVEAALMLMDRLLPAAFRSGSKLFPLFVFAMVRLAAKHGLSRFSVAAYCAYAIALAAVLADYDTAYRFAKTAIRISDRYPRAMGPGVFNIFVRHWKEPLVSTIAGFQDAVRQSYELGDRYQATWCLCYGSLFRYVSGTPLAKVVESFEGHGDALLFDEGAVGMRKMILQIAHNLTHAVPEPHRIEGEAYGEAWVRRRFSERNDATEIGHYHNFSLQLCLLFGKTDAGLAHADELEKHVDGLNPMYFWVLMHFDSGLVRARAARERGDRALLAKARGNLKVVRKAAKQAPYNYAHMEALLAAAVLEASGKDATKAYLDAVDVARRNGAPSLDQGLTLELASEHHARRGDAATADSLREQAAQEYLVWGASALVERLGGTGARSVRATESTLPSRMSGSTRSSSSSGSESALDLMGVMRASQAISGSLVLEDLLEKLLGTMLQGAGAERGLLILKGDRPLVVEAQAGREEGAEAVMSTLSIEERTDVARSVVRYVERTHETVVLADSSASAQYGGDPRFAGQKPMSILCMPILRQQRLVGVLYLENGLATAAFTSARCEFLELLAAQAAISLENALLYDTLDARVKERTLQLRESLTQLEATQSALQAELSDGEAYVRSLLPEPLTSGAVLADWRYKPSAHLGGDGLGYLFLDDGRFAFFVLDVAGHGFAAALLCISILTALHSRRIPSADFGDPLSVLRALNAAFPLSTGGRHFTMWYGVLDPKTGELVCANAAHPSAIVCSPDGTRREVGEPGVMLGVIPELDLVVGRTTLAPGERIFVFSDGAHEIHKPDGRVLDYEDFEAELSRASTTPGPVGHMLEFAVTRKGGKDLDDDFTMIAVHRG